MTGPNRLRWPFTGRFIERPACYGFSIITKVEEGGEEAVRAYRKQIEDAIAGVLTCSVHSAVLSALSAPKHLRH